MMLSTVDIGQVLHDVSAAIQQYPVLNQVTSTTPDYVSGFALEELTKLTFKSSSLAHHMADYYTSKLTGGTSSVVRRKILKALLQLTEKSSRAFRNRLRERDEYLRRAENSTVSQKDGITGSTEDHDVRRLAQELRVFLFSDDVMTRDRDSEPEVEPADRGGQGGLGSSGMKGKYEGFGSSKHVEESMGGRVIHLLERALSPTDPKDEVMKMCLTASTGDYEPVPMSTPNTHFEPQGPVRNVTKTSSKSGSAKHKCHVPGKAGGGWSSSDEDKESGDEARKNNILLSGNSNIIKSSLLSANDHSSERIEIIVQYLGRTTFPTVQEIRDTLNGVDQTNDLNVLKGNEDKSLSLRALLLIEFALRNEKFSLDCMRTNFMSLLEATAKNSKDESVKNKAKKLILILEKHFNS